jgi:hypothetical protein
MNGQRIVETEEDGAWKCQEVSKAGKLKPGIYNLYLSQKVDKSKRHDGIIVYFTEAYVYQQAGEIFVMHSRADFFHMLPEIGSNKSIIYDALGDAQVTTSIKSNTAVLEKLHPSEDCYSAEKMDGK